MVNEADRQYFEAMESLFSTQAWKTFSDDIVGWQAAIASQWRSLKPENLAYEQGRFAGLEQVLKHAELCENLKAQATNEALNVETI